MERLYEILSEIVPGVDFKVQKHLVDDKIFNSLNMIKLIVKLNDEFDIKITPMYLVPENFNSAAAIYAMVQRLEEE